jgi:exopolysaccharide biosynthesis polyprenyl glycosylphosphotransferase
MKPFLRWLDQDRLAQTALLLSDLIWMGVAFIGAYWLRNDVIGPAIQPFATYQQAFPMVALILVATFYSFGLYERSRRRRPLGELYALMKAITLVWLLVMAASFLYKYDYSRIFVLLLYGLGLILIPSGRLLIRSIYRRLHQKGIAVTRVLIVGSGKPAKRVAEKLKEYDGFGYRVIGVVDDHQPKNSSEKYLGPLKDLVSIIQQKNIDELYIADPRLSHERILELIHHCDPTGVKVKVVSDLFEIVAGDIDLDELEGLPSLDLGTQGGSWGYRFLKRCLDLSGALIGLIISLPVGMLIAIAIKLDSPGPVVFAQERVGLNGKNFTIYKFRTMHVASKKNDFAPKDDKDKRITKVGRWLRKTSLDELPQFWNVLKGEMSLVGPRPEMPFIVSTYTDWQRRRLEAKPGITGLWQILGRKDLPLHENIEYDFYYIKNQSILLDLVILIRTVLVVVTGKGAY